MSAVLLKPKAQPLLPARSIVVAPRVPKLEPGKYTGNPFTSEGDVVMDCASETDGKPCGWHAIGPRADVKKAYDEHRKLYHITEIGIVLLNVPRQ